MVPFIPPNPLETLSQNLEIGSANRILKVNQIITVAEVLPQRTDVLDTLSEKTEVLSPSPETQELSGGAPSPQSSIKTESVWHEIELQPRGSLNRTSLLHSDSTEEIDEKFTHEVLPPPPVWKELEVQPKEASVHTSLPDNIVTQDVDEKSIHGVPPPPYSPPQYTVVGPPCGPNCYKTRLLKKYFRGKS